MLPALISAGGAEGWANVAVGQAVGGVAGVLIGFGWGITGPASVASIESDRLARYLDSLLGRMILAAGVLPIAVTSSCVIVRSDTVSVAIACLSTASVSLGATWFFVGTGSAWMLLIFDGLPRLLFSFGGILALHVLHEMEWGLLFQLIGVLVGACGSTALVLARTGNGFGSLLVWWTNRTPVLSVLRNQRDGVASSMVAAAFASLPVLIVQLVARDSIVGYALCDKLLKLGTSSLAPLVATIQGWVPRAEMFHERLRRARVVRFVAIGSAAVVFVIAFLMTPMVAQTLTSGSVNLSASTVAVFSAVCAFTTAEALVGRGTLPALGATKALATATACGAASGLLGVLVGASLGGAVGALAGVGVGLLTIVTIEVWSAATVNRQFYAEVSRYACNRC